MRSLVNTSSITWPLILLSSIQMLSCGSKINPIVKLNRPIAGEEFVDLDAIQMLKLQDGTPVTIGQYMRDQKLPWLVLSFGSKGCGICMEKARYLQANLVNGGYEALGLAPEPQNKVELIGVFTDPKENRDELLGLVGNTELPLTLMNWWDPSHEVMMKYFQAAGRGFTVPLTVMLSPRGILWRVNSDDKISIENLILKIANTISSDATPRPPLPPAPEPPAPPVRVSLLGSEVPGRLDGSVVTSCVDRSQMTLGSMLPPVAGGLRAVLVHKGSCGPGGSCGEAREAIKAWQSACTQMPGVLCSFKEVVVDNGLCSSDPDLVSGGSEFYETFADHFNWGYKPIDVGQGKTKLPEVNGPLTLIFDSEGRIVFSNEGVIGSYLAERMSKDQLQGRAPGPDFNVALNIIPTTNSDANYLATFSAVRSRSKYTMVMYWNTQCSSCVEEIDAWHSHADSAYNFCLAHADFCQVTALETDTDGSPPLAYLKNLIVWDPSDRFDFSWQKNGWNMPLMVEGEPLANGNAPQGWYRGWFRAKFGSSEPRVVLFDREGKVLSSWKSLPGDDGARDSIVALFNGAR